MATNEPTVTKRSRRNLLKTAGVSGLALGLAGCFGGDEDEPEGEPVDEIRVLSLSENEGPGRAQWGQWFSENIEELGFEVQYDAPAIEVYADRMWDERSYECVLLRFGDGFDPDRVLSDVFGADNAVEGGPNTSGYEDDDYEEMLSEQRREMDVDQRVDIVHEMQEKVMEEQVITPAVVQSRPMAYNSERFENAVSPLEHGLASEWNWFNISPTGEGESVIRTSEPEELFTLNPADGGRGRLGRDYLRIIYDRLMRIDPESNEPEPWAAEEVDVVDDTTIEVSLREGMTWHDGEPLTAEDVKFTYEFIPDHIDAFSSVVEALESVDIETDLDLVFNLSEPSAPFVMRAFADRDCNLVPQHIWENVPEDVDADSVQEWNNPEPVGSGPFQVESFTPGEELELSVFEDHFHSPGVDGIQRTEGADTRSVINQLEDESIDIIPAEIPVDDVGPLTDDDRLSTEDAFMTSFHYLSYNLRESVMQDPAIRQAFAHSVPKQDIVDIIYDGNAEVIHAPFSLEMNPWYNEDVPEYNLDLDQAEQILEEAGYEWDSSGQIYYPPE